MMAIEADIAFLEEAAKIDPQPTSAGLDAGRLERLLDLKAPKQTFEQELTQAPRAPKPPQEIVRYFRSVWPTAQETFTPDEIARASTLWNQLQGLTGADIQSGPMAKWLVIGSSASWSELVVRFARRDAQGRLVDGVRCWTPCASARPTFAVAPGFPQARRSSALKLSRGCATAGNSSLPWTSPEHLPHDLAGSWTRTCQNDVDAIHWKNWERRSARADALQRRSRRAAE